MNLSLFSGSANPALAESVARELGAQLGRRVSQRFPDGELNVEIEESVRGCDVYLIQPTSPPADAHLLELLFLADACRRAGAARLTAVIPYFGYARQDRRSSGRQPVGARVVADLIRTGGLERLVLVDLHTAATEGLFAGPVEHLTAVPLLADAVQSRLDDRWVVVAPDLGAVKMAERYARRLGLPVAIVHKRRVSGGEVKAGEIVGDVKGLRPLLIDDMLTTGGTIEAAARAALAAGCEPHLTVVVSHGLFVPPAAARLRDLPMDRLVVTDSVVPTEAGGPQVQTAPLGGLLADAIRRLHRDQSLSDLIVHG